MSKRKMDCSLDDFVMEYLKKVKCEKSSKMFGTESSTGSDHSESLKKFMKFLKENEREKENHVKDDLGFEINFGAFQPEPKVSFCLNFERLERNVDINQIFKLRVRKPLADKNYHGPKKETEKRKNTDVPKEFVEKIKNLGMKVEDAEILFQSKIDWCAVYSDNKIYCVEPYCNFDTKIDNEELTNHMISVHKYGEYPCNYDHCDYVATSKVSFLLLKNFNLLNFLRKV